MVTTFDSLPQKPDASVKDHLNPVAATLLGASLHADTRGVFEHVGDGVSHATASLLNPNEKLQLKQTPRDEGTQKAADAATQGAGFAAGKAVLDQSQKVASDTNYDPRQALNAQRDEKFFDRINKAA